MLRQHSKRACCTVANTVAHWICKHCCWESLWTDSQPEPSHPEWSGADLWQECLMGQLTRDLSVHLCVVASVMSCLCTSQVTRHSPSCSTMLHAITASPPDWRRCRLVILICVGCDVSFYITAEQNIRIDICRVSSVVWLLTWIAMLHLHCCNMQANCCACMTGTPCRRSGSTLRPGMFY